VRKNYFKYIMKKNLNRKFYSGDTLKIAKSLLGCVLVRRIGKKEIRGVITEVEAYIGEDDLASHASKGRTPRTELMFGQPGYAYVYLVYGMYHCFNVVTGKKDFPAAVLIRAVKVDGIEYKKTNGPGKICKIFEIDRSLNGEDIANGGLIWIEKGGSISKEKVSVFPRIGVAYAKHCAEYLWRFRISEE